MFNPENGKRIRLCRGKGNGVDTACLMTASNMLIGRGEDGDRNHCVCLVIRKFILFVNDMMPDDLRDELLAPLAWEILGTLSYDPEVNKARVGYLNEQIGEIAKSLLDEPRLSLHGNDWSDELRQWVEPWHTVYLTEAIHTAVPQTVPEILAVQASRVFTHAATMHFPELWHRAPEIIRAMTAIGDKRPVETVITHEQLAEALDR